MDSSKDRMEDLASLFLPDIMNPSNVTSPQSGASRILKNEEYDMNSNFSTSKSDLNSNTNNDNNSSNSSQPSSFQDFLNNNNFINRQPDLDQSVHQQSQVQQSQSQQFPHTSHYSSFNTYDPGLSQHLFNYNPNLQSVYQQQGLSSQQQSNAFQRSNSYLNKFPTDYDEWLAIEIDYKTTKLKRLLDFKQSGSTSSNDYKIIDKNNNEICIDFNGFLNGRFLTNDIDNNNYIFTKNELQRNEDDPPRVTNKKEDPQVVSCYRRNYIQISINMNIHGFKDDSKLLKLQTSEYGYTTTRVIKYFKIEVLAATNISNNKNVPIIIKNDPKDLEKEKEKEAKKQQFHASYEHKDDLVQPTFINTHEHVIILNNETIENGGIDKYFVVKKLQFKNATPNNGNLTFQNYYHLKAKLSCIVADIYYDDYDIDVDTEGNNNNEILLAELVSEPIIVRGRNPSFYAERNDILIKGRSATSKRAFRIAAQASLDRKLHVDDDDGSGSAGGQEYVHGGDDYMDHEDQDDGGDDDGNSTNINQMNNSGDDEDDGGATGSTGGGVGNSGYEGSNSGQGMPLQSNENMDENSPISTANGEERYSSEAPPLSYSTNQLAMDVKSVDKYKYYPINNVYYLPPINVVYFPHRAHHQSQREDQDQPPIISDSRKSSNVYFK
ncbi:Transcription factor vib-1 [Candida tropicalis]